MHDRALPQREMMVSADLQLYQNGSDGLVFHTDGSCGPGSCNFPQLLTAVAIHPVVLLSPTEWTHIHTQRRTYAITGRK